MLQFRCLMQNKLVATCDIQNQTIHKCNFGVLNELRRKHAKSTCGLCRFVALTAPNPASKLSILRTLGQQTSGCTHRLKLPVHDVRNVAPIKGERSALCNGDVSQHKKCCKHATLYSY